VISNLTDEDIARMSDEDREKLGLANGRGKQPMCDYKSPDYGRRFGSFRNGERNPERKPC
jgi:hypothetical protein